MVYGGVWWGGFVGYVLPYPSTIAQDDKTIGVYQKLRCFE